jgi:hypothetical protein
LRSDCLFDEVPAAQANFLVAAVARTEPGRREDRNAAVADAERIRAIGAANANRIQLEGEATALAAQKQVEAFGGPEIRLAQEIAAQITRAIAEAKLPVVPQIVVGGDGRNGNAIEAITAMVMAAGQDLRQRANGTSQHGAA